MNFVPLHVSHKLRYENCQGLLDLKKVYETIKNYEINYQSRDRFPR